jgi:hypothetical protein
VLSIFPIRLICYVIERLFLLIFIQFSGDVWAQKEIFANTKTGTILVNIVSCYNDIQSPEDGCKVVFRNRMCIKYTSNVEKYPKHC